jgi:hypothetical protein
MHGNNTIRDSFEQDKRIFPGEISVAWIVVHSEIRVIDFVDELTEYVHFLGEFREGPEIVFIMILDDEGYVFFSSIGEAFFDGVEGISNSFIYGKFGSSLAGKDAAIGSAKTMGHVDPEFLLSYFIVPESLVRMSEVRRTAHHWNKFVMIFNLAPEFFPVVSVLHLEKACIPFQSIDLEL